MSSGHGTSGGVEQRRFTRVPINLEGYLGVGERPPVPCTVRDFCPGGMFISADPAAYASAAPQSPTVLYFALMLDGEKRDFQLQLVVARVVAKGVGVTFARADDEAIALLAQLAEPATAPPAPDDDIARAAQTADFDAAYAAVREPLQARVAEHVDALVESFLERVDEVLFARARDAGNNVDETRFIDGQREMRARRDKVRAEVPPKIAEAIRILGNPLSSADRDPQAFGLSDLSLIEKDEFEDFLAISEMVSELEPEFQQPLWELSRRFSHLANREVTDSSNPIGPSVLCNAVAESLKGLQSERRVASVIYEVLRGVMSRQLEALYAAANALLVEHGVLPVIERDKPVVKRRPPASAGFDAAGGEAAETAEQEQLDDLMPGPEEYRGRVAPAPPAAPAGVVAAARPAPPPGAATGGPAGGGEPAAVRAAAPSLPPHLVPGPAADQAPSPASSVRAAPASLPPGMIVPPPGDGQVAPVGAVQAASADPPPAAAGGAAAAGSATVPAGGWTVGPARYAPPLAQRAYSAAQAQLALRRQFDPVPAAGEGAGAGYETVQIVEGLGALQNAYAEGPAEPLDVTALKQRIINALTAAGIPRREVGGKAADAIEVVAGLFGSLLQDALIAGSAKQELTRLQPSVHRAALLDSQFFDSPGHPVRQLIDRLARLRDGKSEAQQQRQARVHELVGRANREFRDDVGVFDEMLDELETILGEQEDEYRERVGTVVDSFEEQQRVLEQRRGTSAESTDSSAARSDLPEEWHKWLDRARQIEVGQRMLMNATSANPLVVSLVWKEPRNNLFVYVDEQGNKANTLTQQQVAMYLRRGILRPLGEDAAGTALDRAMFGVVDRFHRQVEEEATRDALTGFLNRRFFVEAIDAALPDGETSAARNAAVCEVALGNLGEVNDAYGTAVGDALLSAFAAELKRKLRGKDIAFGRLGGAVFGVYWPNGGAAAAERKLRAALDALRGVAVASEPEAPDGDADATVDMQAGVDDATVARAVKATFVIGVTGAEDGLVQGEGLLASAHQACVAAREAGPYAIHVAGGESQQRRQLEQLVAYANKALDRGVLTLHGQRVRSLADDEVLPALHIVVGAVDRSDRLIPSHLFAPALARSNAASRIDLWAFEQTLAWLVDNEAALDDYALFIVPLSSMSLRDEDLASHLMGHFMQVAVPPGRICFELPDRDVVENVVGAGELISTLKEFGCRFVLDEFGSGHANYDYIKEVDMDFVSIKSSFISDAGNNPKDFAMAKSINELVHFMGKKTIGKQAAGTDLLQTMSEIGIDFVHDLADSIHIAGKTS